MGHREHRHAPTTNQQVQGHHEDFEFDPLEAMSRLLAAAGAHEAPHPAAQGRPGTLSQAEMHEYLDDKPQGRPGTLTQAEMREFLE